MDSDIEKATRPTTSLVNVESLLQDSHLIIPYYQRPYRWAEQHLSQLFEDLDFFQKQPVYRLGTIVLHHEGGHGLVRHIVDGQQRLVSLMLIMHALRWQQRAPWLTGASLETLRQITTAGFAPLFKSEESKKQLRENYAFIQQQLQRGPFSEEQFDFLLRRCEFVQFTLHDLPTAFQFFDSQNARGRELEPHDLLKAYHLREFGEGDSELKRRTVAAWESSPTTELTSLFADYLHPTRRWLRGLPVQSFTKKDVGHFKGINLEQGSCAPFARQLQITHHFVTGYQQSYERRIDGQRLEFPFHLEQPILNGRRFFEMTAHYRQLLGRVQSRSDLERATAPAPLSPRAAQILTTIDSYGGAYRVGDQRVRALFDCLLLAYVDRFGLAELSAALELIFRWAYALRLRQTRIGAGSTGKYVQEENFFAYLSRAMQPRDFHRRPLREITFDPPKHVDGLLSLFNSAASA